MPVGPSWAPRSTSSFWTGLHAARVASARGVGRVAHRGPHHHNATSNAERFNGTAVPSAPPPFHRRHRPSIGATAVPSAPPPFHRRHRRRSALHGRRAGRRLAGPRTALVPIKDSASLLAVDRARSLAREGLCTVCSGHEKIRTRQALKTCRGCTLSARATSEKRHMFMSCPARADGRRPVYMMNVLSMIRQLFIYEIPAQQRKDLTTCIDTSFSVTRIPASPCSELASGR